MVTGVATGFTQLDEMTSGFQNSDLVILAGRPGMGKTSLALNIGQYTAIRGSRTVGVFSLEMSAEQLVLRLLCGEARVDWAVSVGELERNAWSTLNGTATP